MNYKASENVKKYNPSSLGSDEAAVEQEAEAYLNSTLRL